MSNLHIFIINIINYIGTTDRGENFYFGYEIPAFKKCSPYGFTVIYSSIFYAYCR